MPTPEEANRVIAALENSAYTWRTVGGIIEDTGLPRETVRAVLLADDRVIKSEVPNRDDDDLYTTYEHYKKKTSLWGRVWAAIRR